MRNLKFYMSANKAGTCSLTKSLLGFFVKSSKNQTLYTRGGDLSIGLHVCSLVKAHPSLFLTPSPLNNYKMIVVPIYLELYISAN